MKVKVHILNVDHGDSIIIEIAENDNTLWGVIDCNSPDSNRNSPTLQFLIENNVNKLEFIILTHPDYDHYSGMLKLVEYFCTDGRKINKFYVSIIDEKFYTPLINSKRQERELIVFYNCIAELTQKKQIDFKQLPEESDIFRFGSIIIHSISNIGVNFIKYRNSVIKRNENKMRGIKLNSIDKNLLSGILCLETDYSLILFCSDATDDMIRNSLNKFSGKRKKISKETKIHFVKVAHHGSKNNHCEELWTKYVIPDISCAGISCGGRKYKMLPDIEVVSCIINNNIKLYCTNKSGCLNNSIHSIPSFCYSTATITKPPPLHGNIIFQDKNGLLTVNTEFPYPQINKIPVP